MNLPIIVVASLIVALASSVQAGAVEKQLYPDLKSPWANSLGMKFVPVQGTEVLFCIWDTRVQDYTQFVKATGHEWSKPDSDQGPDHPAVDVTWDDSKMFCAWLTKKERDAGLLGPKQEYRLPKDWEWSVAVGLNESKEGTPKDKNVKIKDVYPWDQGHGAWPPPRGAGNYAASLNTDDFDHTSPVGSFAANAYGLFDMGGNVSQWCEDFYDGQSGRRVLRGANWRVNVSMGMISSSRSPFDPKSHDKNRGFRVVLGQIVVKAPSSLQQKPVSDTVVNIHPTVPSQNKPLENSLGMKFVLVPKTEVMFCIWLTRIQDYEQFVRVTGQEMPKLNYDHGPDHPVGGISYNEAQKFCVWLTKKDQETGLIGTAQEYRLPSDWEWSMAVGLSEPKEGTPKDKDGKIKDVYPWDQGHGAWPPPRGAGNYGPSLNTDDFERTSPVGSFVANAYGLFDMGGNVWELCEDESSPSSGRRVIRGGAATSTGIGELLSSRRGFIGPAQCLISTGFRVVLGQSDQPTKSINPSATRAKNIRDSSNSVEFTSIRGALVIIETEQATGSGFIASYDGKKYILTNKHVVQGAERISVRTVDGVALQIKGTELSDTLDAVRFSFQDSTNSPAMALMFSQSEPTIGDKISVYGNSLGGGAVTKLEGKVLGIGPDRVEISADFVLGNSGSPILNSHGEVIGIATELTLERSGREWINQGSRFGEVRHWGIRFSGKHKWVPVDQRVFLQQAQLLNSCKAHLENCLAIMSCWLTNPQMPRGEASKKLSTYVSTRNLLPSQKTQWDMRFRDFAKEYVEYWKLRNTRNFSENSASLANARTSLPQTFTNLLTPLENELKQTAWLTKKLRDEAQSLRGYVDFFKTTIEQITKKETVFWQECVLPESLIKASL